MDTQERKRVFDHYMRMDPSDPRERRFMEGQCQTLARELFLGAQRLELLTARLKEPK